MLKDRIRDTTILEEIENGLSIYKTTNNVDDLSYFISNLEMVNDETETAIEYIDYMLEHFKIITVSMFIYDKLYPLSKKEAELDFRRKRELLKMINFK